MASTGTHAFNPSLADLIDEAFEVCGIDPAELKARHIRSAIRSTNLMFAEWNNFGYKQYQLQFFAKNDFTVGQQSFTLPTGAVDIFHATHVKDAKPGTEREMYPISRSDYNALHDKTLTGMPDRYFVDRSTFIGDDPRSTIFLWQTPEDTKGVMNMWLIFTNEDAGNMQNTLNMSVFFTQAFADGLAWHLCRKFAPERSKVLKADYLGANYSEFKNSMPGGSLGRALTNDRDTADAVLRVRFDRYRGRR